MVKKKVSQRTKKINVKKKNKKEPEKSFSLNGSTSKTKIRVIGIGGGGGSIISEICSDLKKIDFIAANTDKRSLNDLSRKVKIFQFGNKQTKGFGTGMDPELGKNAALSEKEKIKKITEKQDVCILVASLGAGTGSGATPVFAKVAKESGCIVYGIFTLPFNFEGKRKMEIAKKCLEEARPYLNAVSIIPNESIFKIIDKNSPLKEALSIINNNLSESLKGLIEAIYNPGLINIDFADFKTILEGKGKVAYLNTTVFEASKGMEESIQKVISSPFYSYGISGATGVLLNVTGSRKIGLNDVSIVSKKIGDMAKKNATVIFGISHDNKYGNEIKVTVLAVGCEASNVFSEQNKKIRLVKEKEKDEEKNKSETQKKPGKKKENGSLKKEKVKKINSDDYSKRKKVKVRRNALEIKKEMKRLRKKSLKVRKNGRRPLFYVEVR